MPAYEHIDLRGLPVGVKLEINGRVVIADGTLIPTCNHARHPELYSGERHRSGAAVQVLSGTDGRLRYVGEPLAGCTHDVSAFRETGLAAVLDEHLQQNLVHRPGLPWRTYLHSGEETTERTTLTRLN